MRPRGDHTRSNICGLELGSGVAAKPICFRVTARPVRFMRKVGAAQNRLLKQKMHFACTGRTQKMSSEFWSSRKRFGQGSQIYTRSRPLPDGKFRVAQVAASVAIKKRFGPSSPRAVTWDPNSSQRGCFVILSTFLILTVV